MYYAEFNFVADSINLFFGFFSIVLAFAQLILKNKRSVNYIIFLFYMSFGIIILFFLMEMNGTMLRYPHLVGVSWPFHVIIAALFYIYIKLLISQSYRISWKTLLLFLPSIIYAAVLTPLVYMLPVEDKIQLIMDYEKFDIIAVINLIFFLVSLVTAMVFCSYELRTIFNRQRIKTIAPFRVVFGICMLIVAGSIINSIGLILESNFILRIDSLLFDLVLLILFFLSYRYPEYVQKFTIEFSREKYKQSQLKGINTTNIIIRLQELFEIEKKYQDPELSLTKVADILQISRHQLSEIINKELDLNFASFINSYRIKEAKELLVNRPEDTILQIAFAVGFNSKTSFNTAFMKIVNKTPSEYRIKLYKV